MTTPARTPASKKRKTAASSSADVINEYNSPFQFRDSDITLISSDDLHFKVHTFHLMAASPPPYNNSVFRDMISVGKNSTDQDEVGLSDIDIEKGKILFLYLSLVYGFALGMPKNSLGRFLRLIKFLHKYECTTAKRTLSLLINSWMDPAQTKEQLSPKIGLLLACDLDDMDSASIAMKRTGKRIFLPPPPQAEDAPMVNGRKEKFYITRSIPDCSVMHLTAFGYDDSKNTSEDVKFA
ncbi:hypothetical protein IAT40_002964 [Kwoniella sp. CBS 6097]